MMMAVSVLIPIVGGVFLSFIQDNKIRNILTAAILLETIIAVVSNAITRPENMMVLRLVKNLSIILSCDDLSVFFSLLFSIIWFLVGLFAFWYIPHAGHEPIFFSSYTITLGALMGISYSSNMITFYMFFEMMTIVSVLMVIHERDTESFNAGYTYLGYSVFGAGLALMGLMFMNEYCSGELNFVLGGNLNEHAIAGREKEVLVIAFLMIIGLAGKAGMYPLHSWLPLAHPVAPAPASAILSGLITKTGVLGVIRVIYYLVGADFLRGTWVQTTLLIISLCTVFIGSMIAFKTKLLKKRLAYSTVSQVSYALFGIFLMTEAGFIGAKMQIISHAISKNILFVCAGAIIVVTGKKYSNEVRGLAKRMPFTIIMFTLASLNLIGIPPLPGFFSKWNLAIAALKANIGVLSYVAPAVLLISAILTAGYLLPITVDAWMREDRDA